MKEKFKELFLALTEYTIPYGFEDTLEPLLPNGFKKDSIGNYYYEIGESKTLFTCHLDTYSKEYKKVNHLFAESDPYIITTDQTTILGADNKLGCTILISMINKGIPGKYYFFIGEEPILSGGVYGSSRALRAHRSFFEGLERAVAFDRKGYGSVVTRQMARNCCSSTFAKELVKSLTSNGLPWDSKASFGYYTDTAVFMDVIPECTNISAGGFNEHFVKEAANLNYTWEVFNAACEIDWESLPVERVIENPIEKINPYLGKGGFKLRSMVNKIEEIFQLLEVRKTSQKNVGNGLIELTYSKWLEEYDIKVKIGANVLFVNDEEVTYNDFINTIVGELYPDFHWFVNNEEDKNIEKLAKLIGVRSETLKEIFIKVENE